MPTDRLLTTVLGALQHSADPVRLTQILGSSTSLLTTLSNPLNVTLLTSQLLQSYAIWTQATELSTAFRIISIFNTAAITVRKHQLEGPQKPYDAYQPRQGGGISCDEWAIAVVKGADDRSSRWQHVLVIAGVLVGMENQDRRGLSRSLRTKLEGAMVTAMNLALANPAQEGILGAESIVLALNHTFPLLSNSIRSDLDYDSLLMIMLHAMTSREGYRDCHFLELIDLDTTQVPGNQFNWPEQSSSFYHVKEVAAKPLIASMGPLSRLIAHAIENLKNPMRVTDAREHLLVFSTRILSSWRRNKLSEIDPAEESTFLTRETLQITFPFLWQLLKTVMFATVVILRAILGKTLLTRALAGPLAAITASQALNTLHNIHFISARLGSDAFSAYNFVNLSSIDILSRYPQHSKSLLQAIYPASAGTIPTSPLQRNLDLFYLNTCEHFTLTLSASDNESLVVTPASPYLKRTANAQLRPIFEAAHSAMLAVIAAPQSSSLTSKILPFYADSLSASFPGNLSPRQFRFAYMRLIEIATPPRILSAEQPSLAETLLELLHHRALNASTNPLLPAPEPPESGLQPPLSEQAVLLLTLLDALPNLPLHTLEEWLPRAADLLNVMSDAAMREQCRARFWGVLESGEMDVERSAVCMAWWTTRGGRERVLFGDHNEPGDKVWMSGGLGIKESRI